MFEPLDPRVLWETAWQLATLGRTYDTSRLPAVLQKLEPRTIHYVHTWRDIERIRKLTAFAVYHLPVASAFGACLKLALVRYALLRRRGLPVTFHLGVKMQPQGLLGHAWLSLHGVPLWEHSDPAAEFHETYRYPV